MKKFAVIFLAVFFTLSAIGVQVTVHQCQGKTSYTLLGIDFNKHCSCKHEAESHKSKCCNNHSVIIKASSEPYISPGKTILIQSTPVVKVFASIQNFSFAPAFITTAPLALDYGPPLGLIPLTILFCNYRI